MQRKGTALTLLEAMASECAGDEHAGRRCRHCLAVDEISEQRALIGELRKAYTHLRAEHERLKDVAVRAYQLASDNWCAQCFSFTGAPEPMLREAHKIGRDGWLEVYTVLGAIARPVLAREYRDAKEAAKKSDGAQ